MLRTRDVIALILAVVLTRLTWTDNPMESLSVGVHLSFYHPRSARGAPPAPLDVDGDGTPEALAVATKDEKAFSDWRLQILDLKSIQKTTLAPMAPPVLFSSSEIHQDATPLHLTTGQVMLPTAKAPQESSQQEVTDHTKKFFCGTDWHDAASRCALPCPGGTPNECPEGERCFADTPCDLEQQRREQQELEEKTSLYVTPGGGLPSIVTLWSNGHVSLHSLTGDKDASSNLELRLMWRVPSLPNATLLSSIQWEETSVDFFDSVTSSSPSGMVVISGIYQDSASKLKLPFVVALDAFHGTVLWDSFSAELNGDDEPIPLPVVERGTLSFARRRSRIPTSRTSWANPYEPGSLPNCLHGHRRSLFESVALPYLYWTSYDTKVKALHFGHDHRHKKAKHGRRSWHQVQKPIYGRPNALVVHSQGGLQVRSLKNGRSLCHLSLLEKTLYADLNADGILDSLQILTDDPDPKDNNNKLGERGSDVDPWVADLKASLSKGVLDDKDPTKSRKDASANLCHALALSGVPSKEQLFSVSLCGSNGRRKEANYKEAPPLVVESPTGGQDVIVALNNGIVSRFRGFNGRRIWEWNGRRQDDFPRFGEESSATVVLSRIDVPNLPDYMRPVLFMGENSLAILSARKGTALASATFPQTSLARPVLGDWSGDGTTDVLVVSADAVWGYQVLVEQGVSIFSRIMVGLLLLGMMLAVVRNRFGSRTGKRSTDA